MAVDAHLVALRRGLAGEALASVGQQIEAMPDLLDLPPPVSAALRRGLRASDLSRLRYGEESSQ